MDKIENKGHNSIPVTFQNFQQTDNPGIVKAECRVAYAGKNRNYSIISKEAFDRATNSIYNVPLVGNWLGDNFGGHDIIMESNGNDVTFKNNTIAYGVVPKDANPRWKTIDDKFGNKVEYFVVDVLLWYERYPEEIEFIANNNGVGQSMEIMVTDGDYDDNYDYYEVKDFYYSALCLLGRDTENSDKHIEPCFEDAGVNFNLGDNIKAQLDEFSKFIEGGGEVVENEKVLKSKETEELVEKEDLEVVDNFGEDEKVEELEDVKDVDGEEAKKDDEAKEPGKNESVDNDSVDNATSGSDDEDKTSDKKDTEVVEASLEELTNSIVELEQENNELKAQLAEFEAEKERVAKEEVVAKYSKLVSADVVESILEKDLSASELQYELALAFADNTLKTVEVKEKNKVIAANNFAIGTSKQEDSDKDKFAIK